MAWLEGKRTYIVALVTAAMGLLEASGVSVPGWVVMILGATGLYTVRAAIK